MRNLVRLVRLSSKEAFKKIRASGKIYCNTLEKDFSITNMFLRHISGSSKSRILKDVIERLSSINLIEKIANEGKLVETRQTVIIEKLEYKKSYKIHLTLNKIDFFIILAEKYNGEIILISVFLNFLEQ